MYIKSTHTQSTTPSRAPPSGYPPHAARVNRPIIQRHPSGSDARETSRRRARDDTRHKNPSPTRAPFFRSTRCAPVDSLWSRTTTSRAGAFAGFANMARARRSSPVAGRSMASIGGDRRATFYGVSTRASDARAVSSRREIRRARAVPSRRGLTTRGSGRDRGVKEGVDDSIADPGVAHSQDDVTFYHFAHTYLVYVKVYPSNKKYILIQLHSTPSIQGIIPLHRHIRRYGPGPS